MRRGLLAVVALAAALITPRLASAAWSIETAAAPYKGTQINVIFLDRPGYRAIIKLLPEFEKKTGIKVNYDIVPYENTREKEVLNFNVQGRPDHRAGRPRLDRRVRRERLDRPDRQVHRATRRSPIRT